MAKYIFPAVFTPEKEGKFSIDFPDIEGCFTCGDDLEDGIDMASDALALMLIQYEDQNRDIPAPSSIKDLNLEENCFATFIICDTTVYRQLMNNTAVKKTLSIPAWLNQTAIAAGLNFSQALQEGLKQQLSPKTLQRISAFHSESKDITPEAALRIEEVINDYDRKNSAITTATTHREGNTESQTPCGIDKKTI